MTWFRRPMYDLTTHELHYMIIIIMYSIYYHDYYTPT